MNPGHPGYLGPHDVGGLDWADYANVPLDTREKQKALWEKEIDVLLGLLWSQKLINIDQLRRGIEYLEPEAYANWSYYGRWAASITRILIENGVITQKEIDDELGPTESEEEIKFNVGDRVTVKPESTKSRWRKPHLRVPGYIFNCTGTIERVAGVFPNPEVGAFQTQHSIMAPLYRVRFAMRDVWPENPNSAEIGDTTIDVEIYQHWLEPARETSAGHAATPSRSDASHSHGDHDHDHDHSDSAHSHSHSHSHSADHGHTHEARTIVEQNAVDKEGPPSAEQHLAASLINLCISKKIITREQLRRTIDALDTAAASDAIGPKLVARAWVDPEFKKRLLEDAVSAAKELGLRANSGPEPEMVAVANEPGIHNVIVCTLCSCYPRAVLGFAPDWYKSRTYRAQMVRHPRALLASAFGLELPASTQLRVHDSTADLRYFVIPERPEGTEGWTEEQLRGIVTRDSMVGVAVCRVEAAKM